MKRDGKRAKEETRQDEKVMTWGKEIEGWTRGKMVKRGGWDNEGRGERKNS